MSKESDEDQSQHRDYAPADFGLKQEIGYFDKDHDDFSQDLHRYNSHLIINDEG